MCGLGCGAGRDAGQTAALYGHSAGCARPLFLSPCACLHLSACCLRTCDTLIHSTSASLPACMRAACIARTSAERLMTTYTAFAGDVQALHVFTGSEGRKTTWPRTWELHFVLF